MDNSKLYEAIQKLSQNSIDSVQDGQSLNALDTYLHTHRPIEDELKQNMNEIDQAGGGIILLVGSAGDGKSHLISQMKTIFPNWGDNCFYNDATASCSPLKNAIETLIEALSDFNDQNINTTTKKLVLAINLGKLNAFIDDEIAKQQYRQIIDIVHPIFDNDSTISNQQSNRIKLILFTNEQIFEYSLNTQEEYPVNSQFLSQILNKIIDPNPKNPFYTAYQQDLENHISEKNPIILNYQLLQIPAIRHSIVMIIIEAIVRYKLIITPREFFDYIYSILVYPNIKKYKEKEDFYNALLPNLLYCGGDNIIQKAISHLDPLKHSSTEHDNELSVLFTSHEIHPNFFEQDSLKAIPNALIQRTNAFYANNGNDNERTTKFIFRLKHLLNYHSESQIYKDYLHLLQGLFTAQPLSMKYIYDQVNKAIPRHYGSYYNKPNMIPLNIQGKSYSLFSNLKLNPSYINTPFDNQNPNKFFLYFDLKWKINNTDIILKMDYQLYSYICNLNNGKLAVSYENEKNLTFNRFIRQLIEQCDCSQSITIVKSDNKEFSLSESFNSIQLQ